MGNVLPIKVPGAGFESQLLGNICVHCTGLGSSITTLAIIMRVCMYKQDF
jgi:hypothetical protein